jgi:hypothetical protein
MPPNPAIPRQISKFLHPVSLVSAYYWQWKALINDWAIRDVAIARTTLVSAGANAVTPQEGAGL